MAAKGKVEVPVVPDFDSPEWDGPEVQRSDIIQAVLNDILSKADEQINFVETRKQVLNNAVDSAIEAALTCIDMLYVARDDDAVTHVSLANGSWEPEPEPVPCDVDTWLRAAIPEQTHPKASYMLSEFLKQQGSTQRSPSMRHSESRRPKGPGESQTPSSHSSPRTASPKRKPSPQRKPMLTPEQQAAEDRLREELEIRKQQAAVAASLDAKDAEAKARLQTLSRELKGKDYAYDHQGRVVPLAQVGGDKAAHLQPGIDYRVKTPEAAAPQGKEHARNRSPGGKGEGALVAGAHTMTGAGVELMACV